MCVCACAHNCVRPRACERDAVRVCDITDVDIGKRANICAPLHVPMCAGVCAMVCTRGEPPVASELHLTASPVYESSEGGQESTYDDT